MVQPYLSVFLGMGLVRQKPTRSYWL